MGEGGFGGLVTLIGCWGIRGERGREGGIVHVLNTENNLRPT